MADTPRRLEGRARGIAYALAGVLVISPQPLVVKVAGNYSGGSFWTFFATKSLLISVISLGQVVLEQRGFGPLMEGLRAAPWVILRSSAINTVVNLGFVGSYYSTTAAKALLYISLNPLWAALFGWRLLGDKLPPLTIAVMLSAIGAIVLVLVPPLVMDGADGEQGSIQGDMFALATGIGVAGQLTYSAQTPSTPYTNPIRPPDDAPTSPQTAGARSAIPTRR